MNSLHDVDEHFSSQWTGPIDAVFQTAPIPEFIKEIKLLLLCTKPIVAPLQNPPLAFAQHKILPPGDEGKIVAERVHCEKHIQAALHKEFPRGNQASLESADLVAAIEHVVEHSTTPGLLVKRRHTIMARLNVMSHKLTHLNSLLYSMQPSTVRELSKSVPINICMLYILNAAIDSPDIYLAHAFVTGFPMKGRLHTTGWYRPGFHPRTNFDESHEEWNHHLIRSIRRRAMKFKSTEDIKGHEECHAATIKEVALGYSAGPFSYDAVCDKLQGKHIRALRRFPQYRYPGAPCRPCDHGGENGINDSFSSSEKLVTENSDFPLRCAIMFRERLPQPSSFRLSTNDLKKAYRQMPSGHPEVTVVAIWNPHLKVVEFFIIYGMPFGLAASVLQFNRPMESVTAVLRRLLGVPCAHYYDDIAAAGPGFSSKSDDQCVRDMCKLIGFILDPDKWGGPNAKNPFLGVLYDFSQAKKGVILIRIKPERRTKLAAMIHKAIDTQRLSGSDAASLRGKLFFACTQAFGRVGRAALQSLVQRQYSQLVTLDAPLIDSLNFFASFIEHADAIPRAYYIDASALKTLLIWTDASWELGTGIMGMVIYVPETERYYYSYLKVPQWMVTKWTPKMQKIGQAEILAAIVPYMSLPAHLLANRNVIHFVDNTPALHSILKGYSKAPDSAWMVNIFHTLNARIQANVWWEHVDSKANCADMPSRLDFDFMINTLKATFIYTVLDEYMWNRPMFQWFY